MNQHIEKLLSVCKEATQEEWGYSERYDACCGFPCTPDGCHESHPSGIYDLHGPSVEETGALESEEDARHITTFQPRNVEKLLWEIQFLRMTICDLLKSADSSWEENGEGHDWKDAVSAARDIMGRNIETLEQLTKEVE